LNISLDIFKKYYDINELVVMGGGAKGVIWQQIMADIYNIKVRKPKFMEEASSTGAAIAAGIGAGIFKDFNVVDRFIEIDSTYLPNCENRKIYDKGYKIFKHSYEALTGIYDEIANYNWR
jgi:xylulokinase